MKLVAPDYYSQFSCTAGKCRHNCCIGWEIDIDDDTFEYYKSLGGQFGKRLMDSITCENHSQFFTLSDNDQCPFLNDNNLCDIITEIGEDKLCQICADHPRYRNFFSNHIEIGLGLCCEEAAKLILTKKDKANLVVIDDDGFNNNYIEYEKAFFAQRDFLFDIIQNREIPVSQRISTLCDVCGINFSKKTPAKWADIYSQFEILDSSWADALNTLKEFTAIPDGFFPTNKWDTVFEQLLFYFMFRHIPYGLYDRKIREHIAFAVYGLYIICLIYAAKGFSDIEDFLEIARMYSSEIEYCEDNINKLLEIY